MTEEISALDKLNEMYDIIKHLQKSVGVMDMNIKLLHDKANTTLFADTTFKDIPKTPLQQSIMADLDNAKPTIGVPIEKEAKAEAAIQRPNSKVEGKLVNDEGKPLHGANVHILTASNKLVKNTKTNRAGIWICFLPAGTYILKYEHEGRVIQQKTFVVSENVENIIV